MKFTIRDGLWLTLVIVISLAWAADHAYFMACWGLSERRVDLGVRPASNPYLPSDLGPYEHWAQEMENSDRQELRSQAGFVSGDGPSPSPFARIDEVISPGKFVPSSQR